jgi:hypothetical protein
MESTRPVLQIDLLVSFVHVRRQSLVRGFAGASWVSCSGGRERRLRIDSGRASSAAPTTARHHSERGDLSRALEGICAGVPCTTRSSVTLEAALGLEL